MRIPFWCKNNLKNSNSLIYLDVYSNWIYICLIIQQRARTMNGKTGPVDLSKNENGWVGLKE